MKDEEKRVRICMNVCVCLYVWMMRRAMPMRRESLSNRNTEATQSDDVGGAARERDVQQRE